MRSKSKLKKIKWVPTVHPREKHIIEDIKKKYPHLTELEIMIIIKHQFQYVKDIIESVPKGDFDNFRAVMLNGLGTFYPSEVKYNKYAKLTESKKLKQVEDEECISILPQ